MALVDCSQCGQRISSSALMCPKCDHPIPPIAARFEDPNESGSGVTATPRRVVKTPAEVSGEGSWSRLPTWLLLVLAFVAGSVILVAGVFAASVVAGSILDRMEDPTPASDTTIVVATTVPVTGGDGLVVGQCINDDELDKYLAGDDFSLVSCDDPHDAEVYHVHEFPSGPYAFLKFSTNWLHYFLLSRKIRNSSSTRSSSCS